MLTAFRRHLLDAGYTRESLRRAHVFSTVAVADAHARALERASVPSAFNTLVRLFMIGAPVVEEEVAKAIQPTRVDDLVRAGLLERKGADVASVAALTPFGDLLIAHDFAVVPDASPRRPDCVLGIGAMTTLLASLTVRRGSELMLDLGAGQGFQALVAAGHADRVVATDLNPRALRLARLGAEIAGVRQIEFREGSLFGPVADLAGRFDLIVSNPPFVIAPPHDIVGLSGGKRGDELCESVVRECPTFLAELGFATMLANWPHKEEADWHETADRWVAGSGCDAWIVRLRTQEAREYAAQWIDESEEIGGAGSTPPMRDWLDFYARAGIAQVTLGAIILRRRGGVNWIAHEVAGIQPPPPPAGEQIQRVFANRTILSGLRGPADLFEATLALAGQHELVDHRRLTGERWLSMKSVLRQTDGFEFPVGIDAGISEILRGFNGKRTVRAAIAAVAHERRRDPGAVQSQCAPVLRRLLELGHLTVVPDARPAALV